MSKRKTKPSADHQARHARVLQTAGDDPASLLLMISVMERIVAERRAVRQPLRGAS